MAMNTKTLYFAIGVVGLTLQITLGEISLANADGRVRMVGPSPGEEAVKAITASLESACNKRDVRGFLSQFTPQRAAKIRRSMEDLFICRDIELEILDTLILSSTDTSIEFGIRYSWHDGITPRQVIASRVTAKKVGEAWMLDCEEILSRAPSRGPSSQNNPPFANAVGGALPCRGQPDWIPADIGWIPGDGCANGRCGF